MIAIIQMGTGLLAKIRDVFSNDQSRFRLSTSVKLTLIPCISLCVLGASLWLFTEINLIYFKANGYSKIVELEDAYYEYITKAMIDLTPYIGMFLVFNFFMGGYLSNLILRPFNVIGDYCQKMVDGEKPIYDPDFFTDLKLLTSFSEYFFNILENAHHNGILHKVQIPEKFTRIHKPVFERSFFLQYSLVILVSAIVAGIGLYIITFSLHSDIIQLSINTLKQGKSSSYFFQEQERVMNAILWGAMMSHVIFYLMFSFTLYSKVAGPAFGIFATMRSFLKGSYEARVHLIGYYYLRPQCRSLNKYLDFTVKNISLQKTDKG